MNLLLPGRQDPSLPFRYVALTIGLSLLPAIFILTGSMISERNPVAPDFSSYRYVFYYLGIFFLCLGVSATTGILAYFDYKTHKQFIVPVFSIAIIFSSVIEGFHVAAVTGWIAASESLLSLLWITARGFHCLLLLSGVILCLTLPAESDFGADQKKTFFLFTTVFGVVTAGLIYYFLNEGNSIEYNYSGSTLERTAEFSIIGVYLFLLFFGIPRLYKRYSSAFVHALFLSMIPSALAEVNLAYTGAHYPDPFFNSSSTLKLFAYLLPFIGIGYNFLQGKHAGSLKDTAASQTSYYLNLMNEISIATSKSRNFNDAVSTVVKIITNNTKFDLGNYYSFDKEKLVLVPSGLWYLKQGSARHILKDEALNKSLMIGEGIPGMVMETGKEMWVNMEDLSKVKSTPRREFFARNGVNTAFVIPIVAHNAICGTIEFFAFESLPEDEYLLQIAPQLTFTLGHVKEMEEADEAREENEVHLKAAQQMALIGSWSLEPRTGNMHWSDEMYHLREISRTGKQPTLKDFYETVHDEDLQSVTDAIEKASTTKQAVNFSYRLVTATGKIKYVIAHAELSLDENSRPWMVYGTSQDITSRVAAERQYETLFRAAPDAIILMDDRGYVTEWNDTAEKMFGHTSEYAVGKKLSELIIPEEFRQAHEAGFRRSLETGETRVIGREIETYGLRKDGSRVPVNLKISRYNVGDHYVFIGYLRDISDRKRSEQLLYSIMNSSLQALMAFKKVPESPLLPENYYLELSNNYARAIIDKNDDIIIDGKRLNEVFTEEDLVYLFPRVSDVERTSSAERITFFSKPLGKWLDVKIVKIEGGIALSAEDVTEKKAIQKKFEENKHLLQQITETVPSLLTLIDIKAMKPVYANKQLSGITGHTDINLQDVPDGFLHQLIYKDDIERVMSVVDKISRSEDDTATYETDFRLLASDGRIKDFNARSKVFKRDPDGSVRLVLAIIEDITAKKKAERELFSTNKKLEAVFNQTFQLMAVISTEGNVEKISKVALDFGMLNEDEVIGKKFWEVQWWPYTRDYHQELREVVDNALAGEFVRTEITITDKRGKETYIDLSVKPILNDKGRIVFVIAEGRDITTEKLAIDKIRTNERLYRVMAENMPDSAVLLIDSSRTIQLIEGHKWNEELFPKSNLIGKSLDYLLRGNFEQYLEYYEKAFDGEPQEFETSFGNKYYKVGIIPVYDSAHQIFAVLAVYHDITAIKRYQSELEERISDLNRSNKDLEQFAYIASHDLQEPLRKIRAFGDRLSAKYKDLLTGDGTLYLDRMENAAERMQRMIDDLLTFSRVSRPKETFANTDLSVVVKEVVSDLEIPIETKHAIVNIGDLPAIEAIPTQMRQLFQNIIGNALKFTREGVRPVIDIAAEPAPQSEVCNLTVEEPDKKFIKVSIADNGIGFDEKYKDRIFSLFQRLHSRSEYEGTGIGLSVCKKIVEFHNGSINVHSTPGKGSVFIFYLPLTQKKRNDHERIETKAG